MTLARFTIGTHSPDCSGCPACSELAAAILANPTNPVLSETMGRPALRTLAERELRMATQTPPLTDDNAALMARIEARLRRVSPGFMRVVAVDVETGTGTYEARKDGKTVTSKFTFELDGDVVVLKTASQQQEDFSAPDPYERHLAAKREREATPESRFAVEYQAERMRALKAEYARADAHNATQPAPRVLSAAERAEFAPPNGYQIALDAMKKEKR